MLSKNDKTFPLSYSHLKTPREKLGKMTKKKLISQVADLICSEKELAFVTDYYVLHDFILFSIFQPEKFKL